VRRHLARPARSAAKRGERRRSRQFRRASESRGRQAARLQAPLPRAGRDEDEVVSFGLFDTTIDDYHAWRGQSDAHETERVERLSAFVQSEHVSGVYGVIDEVED
jgi:heme-degrading monooxygenase HmoA